MANFVITSNFGVVKINKKIFEQEGSGIPDVLKRSAKKLVKAAAWGLTKKAAEAVGEHVATKISNKFIDNRNEKDIEAKIRKKVLQDLKIYPENNKEELTKNTLKGVRLGEGIKNKKIKNKVYR